MYGGVAASYCLWEMACEPYKEGNNWYVKMIHPLTKLPKKVRWYSDKAHADMMPQAAEAKKKFKGKLFGFKNEKDTVICIKARDITENEQEEFFLGQQAQNGGWNFGRFFGGVWYAPKTATVPPIKKADRCFVASWDEFKAAGLAASRELFPTGKSFWAN